MIKILSKILNFIFPHQCAFCKSLVKGNLPICENCLENISYCEGNACKKCGRPIEEYSYHICNSCRKRKPVFERAFTPLIYKDEVKSAIISMKYNSHPSYARAFAFLIANKIVSKAESDVHIDFVTFVPQNKKTQKERGYNQAELIAKNVAEIMGIPCTATLIRLNCGERQATLNAKEREENVKKSYAIGDKKLCGNVLLIDDVYTTGATSAYCSRLLKKMGCEKVYLGIAAINK